MAKKPLCGTMKRRDFIKTAVIATGALAFPATTKADPVLLISDPKNRLSASAPGFFYVDSKVCITCHECVNNSPQFFRISEKGHAAFVYKQPLNKRGFQSCDDSISRCPVDAIAVDLSGIRTPEQALLILRERRLRDITIIYLSGQLASSSLSTLKTAIQHLENIASKKMVLNFAGVDYMDCDGARLLSSSERRIVGNGGQLKFAKLNGILLAQLASEKEGLLSTLQIYENEQSALRSFALKRHKKETPPQSDVLIIRTINKIIADELGVKKSRVTPNALLVKGLGADSLDVVELIMRLEEACKIRISEKDAKGMRRVGDIHNYIVERLKRKKIRAR